MQRHAHCTHRTQWRLPRMDRSPEEKKKSKNANGQRNDKVILTLNTYSHNKGYTIRWPVWFEFTHAPKKLNKSERCVFARFNLFIATGRMYGRTTGDWCEGTFLFDIYLTECIMQSIFRFCFCLSAFGVWAHVNKRLPKVMKSHMRK